MAPLIAARYGNRLHAPEHSRAALLSAYTLGADVLWIRVSATADGHAVLAAGDDTSALTGTPGSVSTMDLRELRKLNYSATFRPRGSAGFHYRPPGRSPLRIEPLADWLAVLPDGVTLLIEVDRRSVTPAMTAILDRDLAARAVLAAPDADVLGRIRALSPDTAAILSFVEGDVAAAVSQAGVDGAIAPFSAARRAPEGLRVGLVLVPDRDPAVPTVAELAEASEVDGVWAVVTDSLFDVADTVRPGLPWIRETFAGTTVDGRHYAFGYAKANRFARVYQDDGVRVAIAPYDGPLQGDETTEQIWYAQRSWPFYSGGGFGLLYGVAGDFAAEVDVAATVASQATMCEMAAVNVDPAAHRAEIPTSARHQAGFYDPHGAPPFVGVEHDEDDGYRINWNLGTAYDANQYGTPVGDGSALAARLRLDRRGPYFSAHYRNATDWVCLGAIRNDSMNPVVYLRVAGKRWRQERDDGSGGFFPIVANEFVFSTFAVTHH